MIKWENDELKIRLAAVPEKGKANQELLSYLSEVLSLGKSKIHLIQGDLSRHKQVCLTGITQEDLHKKIETILTKKNKPGANRESVKVDNL